MKIDTEAYVLTAYIGEDDRTDGESLNSAILDQFHTLGLLHVSVFHGIEGYGAHRELHTARIEVLLRDLPIVIEAIDTKERIGQAAALLEGMIDEGLVTVHPVRAIHYGGE